MASEEAIDRRRRTALIHAQQIQSQKEVSLQLLNATETLLDYPLTSKSAANPTEDDVDAVKKLLEPFQPTDFDALIEERNIGEQCGYVLCPLPHKKESALGRFKILHTKAAFPGHQQTVNIVEKSTLAKWCSEDCRRRAMYIRVQLSEEPAWVRQGQNTQIELLEEFEKRKETQQQYKQLVNTMESLHLPATASDEKAALQGNEHKDKAGLQIHEKFGTGASKAPQPPKADGENAHMLIDGFETKDSKAYLGRKQNNDDEDEDMDDDWL